MPTDPWDILPRLDVARATAARRKRTVPVDRQAEHVLQIVAAPVTEGAPDDVLILELTDTVAVCLAEVQALRAQRPGHLLFLLAPDGDNANVRCAYLAAGADDCQPLTLSPEEVFERTYVLLRRRCGLPPRRMEAMS